MDHQRPSAPVVVADALLEPTVILTCPSNGAVQENTSSAISKRPLLCGISEEQNVDHQRDIVESEEPLELLEENCAFKSRETVPRPLPVKKTRSGASSSNASTKPSLLDNPKISTIRQHYYPEGGWGWVICVCGLVIHLMTNGLLLSYSVLYREILMEFGEENAIEAMWLGSMSLSTGLFVSPLIVAFCRRKSTRLTAVFGGLTSALGCLFTSFASQLHQVFFSYGFLMALGLGMARETSTLMIGQYFKRKREFVEIIIQSGTGIGVAIFSIVFREVIRSLGWRLGLHAVTGIAVAPFFVGIFYRSASLYHPQRRAIVHLKNQRKKIKDKSGVSDKPPFFDFSPLKNGSLVVIMVSAGLCSFGLYTPFFHFISLLESKGLLEEYTLNLQLCLGAATTVGVLVFGIMVARRNAECIVSKRYLCQAAMLGCGFSHLAICAVQSYHGYILSVWMYGLFFGGLQYVLKVLVFESIRAKSFGRAWAYVQWAQSLPVLTGLSATGYIRRHHGDKPGFYFSATCCFVGAVAMSYLNMYRYSYSPARRGQGSCSTCTSQASSDLRIQDSVDTGVCMCTNNSLHNHSSCNNSAGNHPKCQKTISFASTVNIAEELSPKLPDDGNVNTEDRTGDCKIRDHWHEAERCSTNPKCFDKLCVPNDVQRVSVLDEDHVSTPLNHKPIVFDCGHLEDGSSNPKRPITVIEEVTSMV